MRPSAGRSHSATARVRPRGPGRVSRPCGPAWGHGIALQPALRVGTARRGTRRATPDAVAGRPGRGTVEGPPPLANANEPLTPGNEGRCVMPQVIPPAIPPDDPSL